MAESKIRKDFIVEIQHIPVSGYNGTMQETELTIPNMRSGYVPYLINVVPNNFNSNYYVHAFSNPNSLGDFYLEHNLPTTTTRIDIILLWVKK